MEQEKIEELTQKPESLLSAKVQQILIGSINKETTKALKEGEDAYAMELQRAKKLLKRGCWSVRKANPYLVFMEQCLLGKGGDLKTTQQTMKECGEKWKGLPKEKKREYTIRAGELGIYDYL